MLVDCRWGGLHGDLGEAFTIDHSIIKFNWEGGRGWDIDEEMEEEKEAMEGGIHITWMRRWT